MAATDYNRFLYLQHNVGFAFDADSENRFLYVQHDVTTDQPYASISRVSPDDLIVPGETATIYGFNYEGRDDGGTMTPEVRFYEIADDLTLWNEVLSVVSWTINDNPLIPDEVVVTLPNVLPASGFFVIVHTGADKNPYRAYSNFYGVAVEIIDEVLDLIDFDSAVTDWPTSAARDTYFIDGEALDGKFYVTSKRGKAFSFDGTDVESLDYADFSLVGGNLLNEHQFVHTDATGGTFTLSVEGQVTDAIAFDATPSTIKTTLQALPNVTQVECIGAGTSASPWYIGFYDPGSIDVNLMVGDGALLTGATLGVVITTVIEGGSETLPDAQFPMAHFVAQKHSRMWAANVRYASGTEHKSRLHWSALLKPEYWYGTDYIDFDPDDGQEITGLVSYGEALIVFKDRSVQMVTGSGESSFARITLDASIGTVSPYTIESIGGMLLFFDRDAGVWMFDGGSFTAVSDPIRTYLLDGINYGAAYRASAFTHLGRYYLSVPWGASSTPNRTFVFDTKTAAWTEYDYGVRDAVSVAGRLYGVAPGELAGVYRLGAGSTDNGTDIDAVVETPWLAPGGHSTKQRIRNVDASFANLGGAVKIDLLTDFDNATVEATQSVTVSDPTSDQVLQRISGFGSKRWASSQLRFSNVSGSDFQLNKLTLLWTVGSRNRGVE